MSTTRRTTRRGGIFLVAAIAAATMSPVGRSDAQLLPGAFTTLTIKQAGTVANIDPATAGATFVVNCVRPLGPINTFAVTTSAAQPSVTIGSGRLRSGDSCSVAVDGVSAALTVSPAIRQLTLGSIAGKNVATFTGTQRNQPPWLSTFQAGANIALRSGQIADLRHVIRDWDNGTAGVDIVLDVLDPDLDGAGPDTSTVGVGIGNFSWGDTLLEGVAQNCAPIPSCVVPTAHTNTADRASSEVAQGLLFQTNSEYSGIVQVRVRVSDRGATGTGGTLVTEQLATITVTPPQREIVYDLGTVPAETFNLGPSFPTVLTQRFVANCVVNVQAVWIYVTEGETQIRWGLSTPGALAYNGVSGTVQTDPASPGWKRVPLFTPRRFEMGSTIFLTTYRSTGRFPTRTNAFTGQSRTSPSGCLTSPASTATAPNGMYQYTTPSASVLPEGTLNYLDSEYYQSPENAIY